MKHILSLSNFLMLSEKLAIVDNDVDFLYDKYFKSDIETILSDKTTKNLFKTLLSDTSILNDELSVSADKVNRCELAINSNTGGGYRPSQNLIYIGVNKSAYNYVKDYDTFSEALNKIPENQEKSLRLEFTEEKIKGTIHHELAHWIDDSLHNKHLSQALNMDKGKGRLKGLSNINLSKIEIEAIIHNIYQLKRKFYDIWDTISFDDMINLSPSLISLKKTLSYREFNDWKRQIISRMNREDLIGKSMFI